MKEILQLCKSVTTATLAQLIGRLANVAIPLLVIAVAGATARTDTFFFILAVSFYFYGVLANAITQATIPLIISGKLSLHIRHVTSWGLIIAIIVSGVAWLISKGFVFIALPYIAALGLMAGAGIANGLATGSWQACERHIIPGISWSLRLVPLILWWALDTQGRHLAWLAAGIGMADGLRCLLLLKWRSPLLHQPTGESSDRKKILAPAFGMVIVAALINGLNPIIDRLIAALGGTGSISVLETGERIYMMLASLTTIGIATALLPRLSRDVADGTLTAKWPGVLRFVGIWCMAWLMAGWAVGILVFKWWLHSATELTAIQSGAAQQVYWYYLMGLPFFSLALVYVKRLQALRRWRVMVLTSSVSVALNIPASLVLFKIWGVPGIALATTLIHVLNCAILMAASHRRDNLYGQPS